MDKRLFGGALLAAGMVHGAASADFDFSYSSQVVGGYAYGVSGPNDTFKGAGFWSILATEGPASIASSYSTAEMLRLQAYSNGEGGAFAIGYSSYFTVTEGGTATISWDFGGDFFGASGPAILTNLTDNIELVNVAGGTPAGSLSVMLEVGKDYLFEGAAFATSSGIGKVYVEMSIPAHGGLALLGLAGFAGRRRRRRKPLAVKCVVHTKVSNERLQSAGNE